jgi:nucleolar GTP-binding protein
MEVNHYPFTTKQIHVGHFTHRRLQYQLVDTPGLLDRPMEKRNDIELQAISALEHLGSLVLFLIDESQNCGTSIEEQLNLLEDVKSLLPGTELLIVSSKADLFEPRPENWDEVKEFEEQWIEDGAEGEPELPLLYDMNGRVTMSALENVGMESMKLEIVRRVKDSNIYDPMELPEGWYRSDLD